MKKMSNPVHFEKTLSSETLFEGRVITLTKDTALLENGRTATREVVHHHGGACILPYFADGTICMVRQFHLCHAAAGAVSCRRKLNKGGPL